MARRRRRGGAAALLAALARARAALPRLVHFTLPPGARPGALPTVIWEASLASWRRHFPGSLGFQHHLWSDANLSACLREAFPQHLAAFEALPGGIERADVGRYCVLYLHGGVYADLDYEAREDFFAELPPGRASLLECRNREPSIEVENALMASPPGHLLWPMLLEATFGAGGRHRWDDARGGTGPRTLTAVVRGLGAAAAAHVHVLPCAEYHRGVPGADAGAARCGAVLEPGRQRGVHWSTASHTSFVGAALRGGAFFALHPRLRRRPLFREPLVHEVAARTAGAPPPAARAAAAPLLRACLAGARAAGARRGDGGACAGPAPGAEALLRGALALRPAAPEVRYLLGALLQRRGCGAPALRQYCMALVQDPELSSARSEAEFAALGRVAGEAQLALGGQPPTLAWGNTSDA